MTAANVERALELHRADRTRGACAICNRGDRDEALAVSVSDRDPAVLPYICHRCGDSGAARLNGREHPAARRLQRTTPDFAARWQRAQPAPADHPYLVRKGIGPHDARIEGGKLLLPMRNDRRVVGLQTIAADGKKQYVPGSKKSGAYAGIGTPADDQPIVIGEGFATCTSIREVTGYPVAVAFDAGNLLAVAESLHQRFGDQPIIIAADDDRRTEGNPGLTKATAAARAIGAKLAVPNFGDARQDGDTDFNDLRARCGDDAVRACLCNAAGVIEAIGTIAGDDAGSGDLVPELLQSKSGPKACEANAVRILNAMRAYDSLHYDEFLNRLRWQSGDWTDGDELALLQRLQEYWPGGITFSLAQVRNAVRRFALARRRDSLREFVEALPQWDGVPRIEMAFVEAWGAPDNALMRAASANFFVALIARALKPGAQVDTVWAFEGPQGTFKSRSMRALGGNFHAEITASIGTTDFMREMRGLWIAELSELDSLRGREASTVKRLLSAPSDRYVDKWQVHPEAHARRAVPVATTNEVRYWEDSTGARRLVPIPCGEIRIDIIEANRLQWFAEARQSHAAGATWWEFPASIGEAQDDRQQIDPWEDTLRHCIAHGRRSGIDGQGVTLWPPGWIASADIMRDWLRLEPHQQGKASGVRLGHVMRRLGFSPKRQGTARERGWIADTSASAESEVSAQVSATTSL